jgi:hypothetical protein
MVCGCGGTQGTEAQAAGQKTMENISARCSRIAENASVRIEAIKEGDRTLVEAEFANNHTDSLWVPQEPVPSYRVDPQTHSVLLTYGYFEDIYASYRGQYMIPPMKRVKPGERLRWRIEDKGLLDKLLAPNTPSAVRLRVALREFPTSNVRGAQPVDEYVEASCPVQSKATILRH